MRIPTLLLLALITTFAVLPSAGQAQEEELLTAPESVAPRTRHDPTWMIVGYATFGFSYVLNVFPGLLGGYQDRTCIDLGAWGGCESLPPGTSFRPEWDDFRAASLLPIAGPWVQLAAMPAHDDNAWVPYLIINGIAQAVGAVVMVAGVVLFAEGEAAPSVAVVPNLGPDGAGLSVLGAF